MKRVKLYIISILFFFDYSVSGQELPISFIDFVENIQSTSGLSNMDKIDKYSVYSQFSEDFELGLKFTKWIVTKKKKGTDYAMITLSLDNEILYRELYNIKIHLDGNVLGFDPVYVFQMGSDKIDDLVQKSGYVFITENLDRSYRSTFGLVCGPSGSISESSYPMLRLIKDKDYDSLKEMLLSINPIDRMYGYVGFLMLKKYDSSLIDDRTSQLMKDVESMRTQFYFCSGCTVSGYRNAQDIIGSNDLRSFLKRSNIQY